MAALKTTIGNLLLNNALPEDLRSDNHVLDAKGLEALFKQLAERHPEDYKQVAKKLTDIGREVAYHSGSFSFGLSHMSTAAAHRKVREQLNQEIDAILHSGRSDQAKQDAILAAVGKHQKPLEEAVYKESLAEKNPLALQILSGSRGKAMNLKSLRAADLLYQDHRNNLIPFPILKSYSEGLSPAEYFAGAFGARRGVVEGKLGVRDSGYLAKILRQVTHRLVVTGLDADAGHPYHHLRGLPVEVDDPDNEGSLLSYPAQGYKRNTILTPKILKDLQEKGVKHLVVRSALTGGAPDGGLYARDVGVREYGRLPLSGEVVGAPAADAVGERASQASLSSKHTGGVAGASQAVSGFKHFEQLVQIPSTFPGGAAHSEVDGTVEHIEDSPTGGQYITVSGEKHYVSPGKAPKVKPGDSVEAGDVLSEGIPNPAKVVEHKGVGEGRRYFVKAFRAAMTDAGLSVNRRNLELVARGLINHVRLTDEMDGHVHDDVVPYDSIESNWEPREGTTVLAPVQSTGRYLETPVLHYTLGTKIKPSVSKELDKLGIGSIATHAEPPPFVPHMMRGMDNLQSDPDWLVRMLDSNLKKGLLKGVHEGSTSNALGTSFVPALANPAGFGRSGVLQLPKVG